MLIVSPAATVKLSVVSFPVVAAPVIVVVKAVATPFLKTVKVRVKTPPGAVPNITYRFLIVAAPGTTALTVAYVVRIVTDSR